MRKKNYIKPLYIILVGLTIALFMIIGSVQRSQQSKDEIHRVLEEEALSLVETIDYASMNIILSSDEIERQISGRLLTAGRLIAHLDSAGILHTSDLNRIAKENKIFRINIFNQKGKRVLSNHIPNPAHQALMQRGSPQETLKPIFQGDTDNLIIGTKKTRFETGERYAVAVRRTKQGGGAIVLNIDATDFSELKKNIGIGKLIRDLGNNSGIEYAALQDMDGIIVASDSVDQLSSFADDSTLAYLWKTDSTLIRQVLFHKQDVYEVLRPLTIEQMRVGIIRIGLSLDEVRSIERQAQHRNIMRTLVLIFVAFLTISALIATQNYRLSRQRINAMETFTGNILEQMRDAVITIDTQKRITLFNRQAEQLFKTAEKDVIGKTLNEMVGNNLRCLQTIFSDDSLPLAEQIIPCTDGSIHTVSVTVTKLPASTTAVIRDLTEAKRLQQEIEKREKLSAMGELAAGVAHEIRNPLNAISMIAQRFSTEFEPTKRIKEYNRITNVLISETRRVNNIIQQFLRFARPPKINPRPISLPDFLSHITVLFDSGAKEKGVQFSSESTYSGTFNIDHDLMIQALLNILQNALEATPKKGLVQLKCSKSGNTILMEVADTGRGIPKSQLSKIFNYYYTSKPKGTGLGLTISQQIIQQHNGSISVESEEGKGTRFIISLPLIA